MTGPLWLHAALASLMIVIAADCAIRLGLVGFGLRRAVVDVEGLHLLMGVAMAGMLLPQLRVLPTGAWEAVFGVGALWFGGRTLVARKTGSGPFWSASGSGSGSAWRLVAGAPLAHVIECLAMIFMLLPAFDEAMVHSHSLGQAMTGMSRNGLVTVAPAVALILALCLVGYVVWTTDALARSRSARAAVATAGAGNGPGAGTAGVGVAAAAGGLLAPRLAAFSTIAMALVMGYMLIQLA
jgi:hypothetical protein